MNIRGEGGQSIVAIGHNIPIKPVRRVGDRRQQVGSLEELHLSHEVAGIGNVRHHRHQPGRNHGAIDRNRQRQTKRQTKLRNFAQAAGGENRLDLACGQGTIVNADLVQ